MLFPWIIFFLLAAFAAMRLLVLLTNLIDWPRLPVAEPKNDPMVSILIPARNEAAFIEQLLQSIYLHVKMRKEVIILDDHSDDNTAAIAAACIQSLPEAEQPHWKLISGKPLPEGWLGKNFACHQLAERASGDYFLFLDADCEIKPSGVESGVAYLQKNKLALLSLFPEQVMNSAGEWLTVPLMHYMLLSMLPLVMIRKSGNPAFAGANGQYMLFDAENYRKNQWHARVKDEVVEDIVIQRRVKADGFATATLLGNGKVSCRMYENLDQGIRGFSKNMAAGFGGNAAGLMIWLSMLTVLPILAMFTLPWWMLAAWAAAALLIRLLVAILAGQNPAMSLLLHPAMTAVMTWTGMKSIFQKYRGGGEWKGRSLGPLRE